jgi:Domain of unknown function (DUF397)
MSASTSVPEDLEWHISRTCDTGACVGVARKGETVFIGNTNDLNGPVTKFTKEEWRQFLAGAKLGNFDEIA